MIKNIEDLAAEVSLGDTIESISKAIFKGTACGAWVDLSEDGTEILVGSIVEGCDYGTETHKLSFPLKMEEFWQALSEVESEALSIWNNTHGCSVCAAHWGINPESAEVVPVWEECHFCHGEGIVI